MSDTEPSKPNREVICDENACHIKPLEEYNPQKGSGLSYSDNYDSDSLLVPMAKTSISRKRRRTSQVGGGKRRKCCKKTRKRRKRSSVSQIGQGKRRKQKGSGKRKTKQTGTGRRKRRKSRKTYKRK